MTEQPADYLDGTYLRFFASFFSHKPVGGEREPGTQPTRALSGPVKFGRSFSSNNTADPDQERDQKVAKQYKESL